MLLVYNCDRPEPDDPRFAESLARVNAFADECRRRGVFVSGHPLRGEHTTTTVSLREGRTLITDGPFAETHEHLGGAYVFDCRDLDEALELAALCPMAERGSIEVRPVAGMPGLDHRPARARPPRPTGAPTSWPRNPADQRFLAGRLHDIDVTES